MYDDLVQFREPPPKRRAGAVDGVEEHFSEAAVMLAFAMYLLRHDVECVEVSMHPDGEHGKRFDISGWLQSQEFVHVQKKGSTTYGGTYVNKNLKVLVSPTSGKGDVVAKLRDVSIVAECKGGVINSRHAGQLSRLRKGLCEVVGLLLTRELDAERHIAVVPYTAETEKLAKRLIARTSKAGIEIALAHRNGEIEFVSPPISK